MVLIMAEHKVSGDVLVMDVGAGICSDPIHFEYRDAPLGGYQLVDELGEYDPNEWEIIRREED